MELGPLTDDAIAGDFRVYQRRRGHRYSLDDIAVAWEAARRMPEAPRALDLGTGLGSVLIMLAYRLPEAALVGVEAQPISFALLEKNLARNKLNERTVIHHGDFREPALRAILGGPFPLITGTPPYFPPGTATLSPDPQRAHARVELRGGIEDYLRAAGELLAPGGRAVICGDARRPDRALEGAAAADLVPIARREVVPRAGHKGALLTVWTFARAEELSASEAARGPTEEPPLIARDEGGGRTEQAHQLRLFFGLPVNREEAPSPGKRAPGRR